jgi:hypothetical protein
VYGTGFVSGSYVQALQGSNKFSIAFSGASDTALNYNGNANTICNNFTWLTTTSFTCTMSSLSSTHSTTGSTSFVLATTTAPLGAVSLWPMAEVIDVQDYATSPPSMNGTLVLEPNIIAFAPGDTVAELNHEAGEFANLKVNGAFQNPWSHTDGLIVNVTGTAMQVGGNSTNNNAVVQLGNLQANNVYADNGGPYLPPNVEDVVGSYYDLLVTNEAPSATGSLFYIQPTAAQKANPLYSYNLIASQNLSGADSKTTFTPNLGDESITATGQLGLGGTNGNVHLNSNFDGGTTNDRVSAAALAVPTGVTVTQGPGTGTLADGTYCYQIESRNNAGWTNPSTEVCGAVANGGANSVLVSWTRNKGTAIGYYVYGRLTGAEGSLGTVGCCSFIDTGGTIGGGPHTANGTLPDINNVSAVNFNSAGATGPGSFTDIVKAPNSLGASQTITLPSVTGAIPSAPSTPIAGKATCWKTTTTIGYCSTQPDSTGSCTCN